jgi:glycosyltransferase involved in cell wall biosynthesis
LYQTILGGGSTVVVDSSVGEQQIRESFPDIKADIKVLPFCAPPYVEKYLANIENDSKYDEMHVSMKVRHAAREPYLYYPAAHRRQKNHEALIAALKLLADAGIAVRAILSGPAGPTTDQLTALIEKSDLQQQIVSLPYVSNDELCYLYKHARALVMPTLYGPTNIPPLEAFALGCPVVISDIYGMREQTGDAALLIDPLSSQEIADAIKRLWMDSTLCEELIIKGHKRSEELSPKSFSATLKSTVFYTIDYH